MTDGLPVPLTDGDLLIAQGGRFAPTSQIGAGLRALIVGAIVTLGGVMTAPRAQNLLDFSGTVPLYEYSGTFTAAQAINLGGVLPSTSAGTLFTLASADGANTRVAVDCYKDTAPTLGFDFRHSGGTRLSRTQSQSGVAGAAFAAWFTDNAGSPAFNQTGRIFFQTTEAHTTTARGTALLIEGVVTGSTTRNEWSRWQDAVLAMGGFAPTAGNGLIQLLQGTTKANGIAFGTDTFFYRDTAGSLTIGQTTNANLNISGSSTAQMAFTGSTNTAFFGVNATDFSFGSFTSCVMNLRTANTNRIRIGSAGELHFFGGTPVTRSTYGAPTGTATRTTFDTTTVTLPLLAERVKALIDDLRARGDFA